MKARLIPFNELRTLPLQDELKSQWENQIWSQIDVYNFGRQLNQEIRV